MYFKGGNKRETTVDGVTTTDEHQAIIGVTVNNTDKDSVRLINEGDDTKHLTTVTGDDVFLGTSERSKIVNLKKNEFDGSDVITYIVKVHNIAPNQNIFRFNDSTATTSETLTLTKGRTYVFDQSDASNTNY